jgi:hypothetical protein
MFSKPRTTTLQTCSCQFISCYGLPCRHILQLHTLQQREVSLDLFDSRWKQRSPAAVLAAVQALLQRRPARSIPGPSVLPDRSERYTLILAAARGVAEVGAATSAGYQTCLDGFAQLMTKLRLPAGAAGAAAPAGRRKGIAAAAHDAAAPDAGGEDMEPGGPLCHGCWERGHNKNNRMCPNFGKPPLAKPSAFGRAKRVRELMASGTSSDEAEDSDEEDGNDNVCHACSQPGTLIMCDMCPRAWHDDCLSLADRGRAAIANTTGDELWLCSVCAGEPHPVGFIGNPLRGAVGRGGNQNRGRFRSASEGTRATRAAAKKRGRKGETPRFR